MKVSLSLSILQDLRKTLDKDYNPDGCLQQVEYMKRKENPSQDKFCRFYDRIMCRHCIEYDETVHAPYCENCRKLPQILEINRMVKFCHSNEEEFYNVDKSTRAFIIIKDLLPESDAEVDSFFYSIVTKERLPMDSLTLNAMAKFMKIVFENEKFISFSRWCIESGKNEDCPNPHMHAVVKFKDSKNWSRFMMTQWRKIFPDPEFTIDFKRFDKKKKKQVKGIDIYRCMNGMITADKVKYLDNSLKNEFGDNHSNFIDLGINGGLN